MWGILYYACVESLKKSLEREQQKDVVVNSAYMDPRAAPSRRGTKPGFDQSYEAFRPAFKSQQQSPHGADVWDPDLTVGAHRRDRGPPLGSRPQAAPESTVVGSGFPARCETHTVEAVHPLVTSN